MPFAGTGLGGEERDRLVEQPHDPALGEPEPADHPQQRRLARAVRAEHGQRLAAVDVDVHVEQHLHRAVAEVEVADLQQRRLGAAPFLGRAHPLFFELLDHAPHVALGEPCPVEHEAGTEHGEERQHDRERGVLALELGPEVDHRRTEDERADEHRVDERTEALGARLRRDDGLGDGKDRRDRADDAREPERAEDGGGGDRMGPPPDEREVEPEEQDRRQRDRAVRRPAEGAPGQAADQRGEHERGQRHRREQEAAVGGADLEVTLEPEVEPDRPADEPEAHRQHADAHVAQRRDLAEPGERVQRGEVLGADLAVVVEDLLHLGSTPARVGETAGGEREDGGERGDHEEGDPPLVAAVEDAHAERHHQWPDHETGRTQRHVRGEHVGTGADGERVGEEGGLHRHRRQQADAGEREDAEELPAVERGARQHQADHREHEHPPHDARAVRGDAVDVVPERLRHQHDREAGQDRDLHEEPEAPVVVVGDLDREDRASSRRPRARAPTSRRRRRATGAGDGRRARSAAVRRRPRRPGATPRRRPTSESAAADSAWRRDSSSRTAPTRLAGRGTASVPSSVMDGDSHASSPAQRQDRLDRRAIPAQTGWTSQPVDQSTTSTRRAQGCDDVRRGRAIRARRRGRRPDP